MEAPPITFDQLPHVVNGLSEKLDRVLDILEKLCIANTIKNVKLSKRKKAPPGATKKSGKSYVVSVRLNEEQYKTVQKTVVSPAESCQTSGVTLCSTPRLQLLPHLKIWRFCVKSEAWLTI